MTDRPMGAGALQRVYVDTASSTAEKLAGSMRGLLANACKDQHILVCYYSPSAGDMDPYTVRYFWYETEPDGWGELVKTLPAAMKLDRIGPARELPAKYVSGADILIAR